MLALAAAGCASTSPGDYAKSMPPQDPKWTSPPCVKMRADAAIYQSREKPAPMVLLGLGPYGLGIYAAAKDHQEKKRREFVRNMHLACSSQPLPSDLANLSKGNEPTSRLAP